MNTEALYRPSDRFISQATDMVAKSADVAIMELPYADMVDELSRGFPLSPDVRATVAEALFRYPLVSETLASTAGAFGSLPPHTGIPVTDKPRFFSKQMIHELCNRNRWGLDYARTEGKLLSNGRIIDWNQSEEERTQIIDTANKLRILNEASRAELDYEEFFFISTVFQPVVVNSGALVATMVVTHLANAVRKDPAAQGFTPAQLRESTLRSVTDPRSLGYVLMKGNGGVPTVNASIQRMDTHAMTQEGTPYQTLEQEHAGMTYIVITPSPAELAAIHTDQLDTAREHAKLYESIGFEGKPVGVCPFRYKQEGEPIIARLLPSVLNLMSDDAWSSDQPFA